MTGRRRRRAAQVAGSAWPTGLREGQSGCTAQGASQPDRRRPRSNRGRGAARPAGARERPLQGSPDLSPTYSASAPWTRGRSHRSGPPGARRPRRAAGSERRNPTSVCTMRSRAHSCRHRGKKGREEGETLSQAMTVCEGLFRASFSGDPGALLLGPLSRRLEGGFLTREFPAKFFLFLQFGICMR